MTPKGVLAVGASFLAVFGLVTVLGRTAQEEVISAESELRTFFTARSAKADDTILDSVRKDFDVDDGGPLKSVALDLNGDARLEKFVLNAVPSASGGSQWLIYDQARGVTRGLLVGTIVFILRQNDEGYPRLETYWKQGGDMAIVFEYRYSRGRYARSKSRSLTVPEIDEYFQNKPALDLDQELVEIRIPSLEN